VLGGYISGTADIGNSTVKNLLTTVEAAELSALVKSKALALGFDLVGITSADAPARGGYLRQWLADGKHGDMNYMVDRVDERVSPTTYFPEARSVVCVGVNYHVPLTEAPTDTPQGRVARYALGTDYHTVIKDRLYELADWLRGTVPGATTRCGVDTVPVMERELAARAGIGWVGKNTIVINEQIGSWILLGEVLTSLDLPVDTPAVDRCGTCTRCIDACPTRAITAPYQLDATRCISYLTIEHEGDISPDLRAKSGDWIFGCDVCQDVCPYNTSGRPVITTDPALKPRFASGTINLNDVLNWTNDDYHTTTRRSAMRRVKLPVLQRNAMNALYNNTTTT